MATEWGTARLKPAVTKKASRKIEKAPNCSGVARRATTTTARKFVPLDST
jgi:hypothetical protein